MVGKVIKGSLEVRGCRRDVLHRPIDVASGIYSWTIATAENSVYNSYHCYIHLVSKAIQTSIYQIASIHPSKTMNHCPKSPGWIHYAFACSSRLLSAHLCNSAAILCPVQMTSTPGRKDPIFNSSYTHQRTVTTIATMIPEI